jgi:hypothetical protein
MAFWLEVLKLVVPIAAATIAYLTLRKTQEVATSTNLTAQTSVKTLATARETAVTAQVTADASEQTLAQTKDIHQAVNSERSLMQQKLEEMSQRILEMSAANATLLEEAKAANLALTGGRRASDRFQPPPGVPGPQPPPTPVTIVATDPVPVEVVESRRDHDPPRR